MKDSEIYLRAAELINNGTAQYSCCAISSAECGGVDDLYNAECAPRRIYDDLFVDLNADTVPAGYGHISGTIDCLPNSKEWRLTALCFMAAIAKSEGR